MLLTKYYEGKDFTTGKPKITKYIYPTKVCVICGRINEIDQAPAYYIETICREVPFIAHKKELSSKALELPKWFADFFDKFASKVEENYD